MKIVVKHYMGGLARFRLRTLNQNRCTVRMEIMVNGHVVIYNQKALIIKLNR